MLLGLEGHRPDEIEPDTIESTLARIRSTGRLKVLGRHEIEFDEPLDVLFHRTQVLPGHSNGMRFAALDANGQVLLSEEFYSIGGGFIQRAGESADDAAKAGVTLPYPFSSADDLLTLGRTHGLELYELMLANERSWRTDDETRAGLMRIWRVMQECVERGFNAQGVLPGVLKVRRRAPKLYRTLTTEGGRRALEVMDWVNAFALAVNEENAAGGRVVTAPTNGAAGIIPAVLHYYTRFEPGAEDEGVVRFLLTAGAIGMLYKQNASISGAEMGCQGEVGVACSMAAAGLVAALHGTNEQIENAAEIGMEHNLGPHLRSDRRPGADPVHRAQRDGRGEGHQRRAPRHARRWQPQGDA